jgi:hypothetical protein
MHSFVQEYQTKLPEESEAKEEVSSSACYCSSTCLRILSVLYKPVQKLSRNTVASWPYPFYWLLCFYWPIGVYYNREAKSGRPDRRLVLWSDASFVSYRMHFLNKSYRIMIFIAQMEANEINTTKETNERTNRWLHQRQIQSLGRLEVTY